MDVVYYFDKNLGYCPVKKYLGKYIENTKDTKKEKDCKNKILIEIRAKIQAILENSGLSTGFISGRVKGYSLLKIRQKKNKNILIRILYFCHDNKMILLNAFEKPKNYKTKKEKRDIDKQFKIAETYKNKFKLNPKLYERYN